jgi:hypothetical protein
MANPATTADVVARWRPLSTQETTNAQTFLDDAWVMLRRHFTAVGADIEALIADDTDLEADVVRVMVAAVLRVLKNPDGLKQESIDDYTYQRDEAVAAGLLYFAGDELDGLVPGSGVTGRVFMVDPLANWAAQWE